MEDELDFKAGDKIQVILDDEEYNDGWYYGKNLRTQEEGLYPVVFTQEINVEKKYPLNRIKSTKRIVSNDSLTSLSLQKQQNVGSPSSVKNPMEDIDSALETMRINSESNGRLDDVNSEDEMIGDFTQLTIATTTSALDIADDDTLNPLSVKGWTPEDVSDYFISLGFDRQLAKNFQKHKISGSILLELELAYLRELDIDSFGTRFEMFKEIENIKRLLAQDSRIVSQELEILSSNSNFIELMPPAFVDQQSSSTSVSQADPLTYTKGHARRASKSLNDIPSTNTNIESKEKYSLRRSISGNRRPVSVLINGNVINSTIDQLTVPKSVVEVATDKSAFISPRRAPKPPSYPSPVQPPKSPLPYRSENIKKSVAQNLTSSPKTSHKPLDNFNNSDAYIPKRTASSESFTELIKRVSILSNSDADNKSKRSDTSSVYGDAVGHIKPIPTRNSNHSSFVLSPNKQHFTENAAKLSPTGKLSKNAFITPTYLEHTSPLKNRRNKKNSSKRRSMSAKNPKSTNAVLIEGEEEKKRSLSEAIKGKKATSKLGAKTQTTAFTEGIRSITVHESMKDADCSGWMNKKGSGPVGVWKTRFFTLHGTRLSYFNNTTDSRERGLIDITGHRVVPARDDDKLVSLYAASTGKGRYCFKLVPPQPGSKKGLTFTQPKVHYFAVDTNEEMRTWMTTLIKTTIDIDSTVPVVSSYSTPTVSLGKAQEMLSEAREENRLREQQREMEGDESRLLWDQQQNSAKTIINTSSENTSDRLDLDPRYVYQHSTPQMSYDPDLSLTTSNSSSNNNNANVFLMGFSSPYLLASGMSTPNIVRRNSIRAKEKVYTSHQQPDDYFGTSSANYTGDKI